MTDFEERRSERAHLELTETQALTVLSALECYAASGLDDVLLRGAREVISLVAVEIQRIQKDDEILAIINEMAERGELPEQR